MVHSSATSLAREHRRRFDVPLLIVVATGLLIAGLSLPVLSTDKLVFWHDEYSIWSGVIALFGDGHYGLTALILFFSIVFPFAKLTALAALWFVPFNNNARDRMLRWLKTLGRWSMLDVFVVAILVVITKTGGLLDAQPRIGIYFFAAAILLSLVATMLVDRIVRPAD